NKLMKYQYWGFAVILSLMLVLGKADATAASDSFVSVADLKAELKSKNIDHIIKVMNRVKQMSYQGQILTFLHDLWDEQEVKYPDLPWETIRVDVIKLEIADILLQANANGKIKIDREKFHKFILELIDSADIDVVRNAIIALSIIDDEKDVDKIFFIAKRQLKGTFRASVLTLSKMCNPAAGRALDRLEDHVTKSDRKSFITKTRDSMATFKERTGWCKSN
ncbi:MAG: hypothetical protein GXP23_05140, partial [Gammaproteobacteria bacterium]|nr:hypothetical protein [Gammaproteobacteria bacterium]